ncbi:MAG: tRNA pseudouridine(38-40) synthase TruA [Acidobacteria bacterium]|nr:tRNA pseudouridine(38-40) synthase TruA [Acidobacteriota bacterium]
MSPSAPERRIRITIAYDGTAFHGWQVQPGLTTIQGELERAYLALSKTAVKIQGSGRTDAGVHALAQVAAFTTTNPIPCDNLRRAMNRLLPPAIRVLHAQEVASKFHARFDAVSKLYEYRIFRDEICSPFERPYVHHFPYPLDEAKMAEAAGLFVGVHDFGAFAASDEKYGSNYCASRTIYLSELVREGPRLFFRVRGSGFLKHMVRNLAGTLIEVGKGNLGGADVRRLLTAPGGSTSGSTAPASGLFLVEVTYKS